MLNKWKILNIWTKINKKWKNLQDNKVIFHWQIIKIHKNEREDIKDTKNTKSLINTVVIWKQFKMYGKFGLIISRKLFKEWEIKLKDWKNLYLLPLNRLLCLPMLLFKQWEEFLMRLWNFSMNVRVLFRKIGV